VLAAKNLRSDVTEFVIIMFTTSIIATTAIIKRKGIRIMTTEQMVGKMFGASENPYEVFKNSTVNMKIKNAAIGDIISFDGHRWHRVVEIQKTMLRDPIKNIPIFYIELSNGKKVHRSAEVSVQSLETDQDLA